MQKKMLIIVTVTVVVLLVATLFAYNQSSQLQNQVSELQSQNSDMQNQINDLQEKSSNLQNQNDELQQQLDLQQKWLDYEPNVRIVGFSSGGGWWNPVGVTLALDLTIQIYNWGVSDIINLTLEINWLNVDEAPDTITKTLDILYAGNFTEIEHSIYIGLDQYSEFHNHSLVATRLS